MWIPKEKLKKNEEIYEFFLKPVQKGGGLTSMNWKYKIDENSFFFFFYYHHFINLNITCLSN
jgi:hypothetical protein